MDIAQAVGFPMTPAIVILYAFMSRKRSSSLTTGRPLTRRYGSSPSTCMCASRTKYPSRSGTAGSVSLRPAIGGHPPRARIVPVHEPECPVAWPHGIRSREVEDDAVPWRGELLEDFEGVGAHDLSEEGRSEER